jgi:hypothetical protein
VLSCLEIELRSCGVYPPSSSCSGSFGGVCAGRDEGRCESYLNVLRLGCYFVDETI